MSILTRIRSWFCGHYFSMGQGAWRDDEEMIHAVCVKCGREYVATCGMQLPWKRLLMGRSNKEVYSYKYGQLAMYAAAKGRQVEMSR